MTMAGRLQKVGLDFFPLTVNIWEDDKIQHIGARFEEKGELIVIKLLQSIYRHKGYYREWNEDEATLFAKGAGKNISPGLVKEVVNELLKREFFDTLMHTRFSILTSFNIQRTYEKICKDSGRKGIFIRTEHRITPWMLSQRGITAEEIELYGKEMPLTAEEMTQTKRKETKLNETTKPPPDFLKQILDDQIFCESAMMLHKIDEKKLDALLKKFFITKKMNHKDHWKDFVDFRDNFSNWLPIELGRVPGGGSKFQPVPTPTVHTSQVKDPDPPPVKVWTEEQKEAARKEMEMRVDNDFTNFCENENCHIKYPVLDYEHLFKQGKIILSAEQKKEYELQAIEVRKKLLNKSYDPISRMTLAQYKAGRLPDADLSTMKVTAIDLALRDYFRKKRDEEFAETLLPPN